MAEIEERERIVGKAQEKFFALGFSRVTVEELAADLGMSKKTIYKFFPSKEEILRGVVQMMMKRIEREVGEIVSSNKPFEQKMTDLLAVVGRVWGRAGRAQLLIDMKKHAPELWKEVEQFRREHLLTKVHTMFLQAKHEGVFRNDLDTDLFMLMFLYCMEGILNPYTLSEHSFSAQEAFRSIFRVLFEGALTDEARSKMHLFEPTYSPTL
jgi:AcrR family transcriptional regulator